ncbi:MAG TPA: arginine N-succinyltransferase [Candidatus Binatia bacterium]|jgi:arginine N-succinyltransferase|nr:arginine N-succinyltransferase [Candidatus Binatia bacterium]
MLIPFLLREATAADVPQVLRLARVLDSINLPTEENDLVALIHRSTLSFRGKIQDRQDGMYLFVLEERATQRIAGTAMIIAKHGTPESPHFYLEMATDQRYSKTLKKMFRHTYLILRRCLDGPTEVGGLIVDPAYRQHEGKIGKQLSFVRFLYLAMYPERFEDEVVAEMMPPLTADKESLFWECYGKRVTGLSFREADKLSTKDKEFIDTLFPSIPLYVCMLPVEVQEQIGQVGPDTRGAVHLLEKVGLRFLRHVDPFDGGPYYGAKVGEIVLVQQFRRYRLRADHPGRATEIGQDLLIGWEGTQGFCAARVNAYHEAAVLYCPAEVLQSLDLQEDTEVGAIPFL